MVKIPPGNGKHGWTGTSKCGSAAGLGVGAWVQAQCGILPEVDGRWWAHRRYSNHRITDATRAGLWGKFLQAMGNMDGQACPNVAVQPGSGRVHRYRCSVEYCQRLMGGGGHIEGTPTIG